MEYSPPFDQIGINNNASYVNGNPATGVQGSIPNAPALEQPQREILDVITAAGLVPSATDLTQLDQAIDHKIAAAAGLLSVSVTAPLTGNGTSGTPIRAPTFVPPTSSVGGVAGFVPAPPINTMNYVLTASGWAPATSGATATPVVVWVACSSSIPGTTGLLEAPGTGNLGMVPFSDYGWRHIAVADVSGLAADLAGYLPLAGGTLTGRLIGGQGIDVRGSSFSITDLTAGVDSKIYDIVSAGGTLYHRIINDTYSTGFVYLYVNRSQAASASINFAAPLNANQYASFYGGANFSGGATGVTQAAGDISKNFATDEFVTRAIANALPAGAPIAWGDSAGQAGGGTISIGTQSATFTFAAPRSNSNYSVVGLATGYGAAVSSTSINGTVSVGPIWATDIIRATNVSKTTTGFTITYVSQIASDSTGAAITGATMNTFHFAVYQ